MTTADRGPHLRVLSLLPTARDGQITAQVLDRNGIAVHHCANDRELAAELARGAGAVLVSEEVLAAGVHAVLVAHVRDQPRWSDLPVLLVTTSGPSSAAIEEAMATLGNVTLMERPLRVAALVSTMHAALRARTRQYQIQTHLSELELARQAETEHARRKDEFLAMLGHELRNPLAPIRNALEILALDDADPVRRAELRRMMARQVEHLVRLVDDLLEASRLSQGKITLQRSLLDLRQVLEDAVEVAGRARHGDAPGVRLSLPDAPLPVDADPVRLAQVFGNLLANAIRYGKPGGTVVVSARREEREVVVSVRDDGDGIEPELLPRIFELFSQGRRSEHRLHDGLGIGLALVHRLVDMHGGTVAADSAGKGLGAEFVVRLPLSGSALAAPVPVPDGVDEAKVRATLLERFDIDPGIIDIRGQ